MDFVITGSNVLNNMSISKAKFSNWILLEINDVQPNINFHQNFRKYDRILKVKCEKVKRASGLRLKSLNWNFHYFLPGIMLRISSFPSLNMNVGIFIKTKCNSQSIKFHSNKKAQLLHTLHLCLLIQTKGYKWRNFITHNIHTEFFDHLLFNN